MPVGHTHDTIPGHPPTSTWFTMAISVQIKNYVKKLPYSRDLAGFLSDFSQISLLSFILQDHQKVSQVDLVFDPETRHLWLSLSLPFAAYTMDGIRFSFWITV